MAGEGGYNLDKQSMTRVIDNTRRGERTAATMPNTTARPRKTIVDGSVSSENTFIMSLSESTVNITAGAIIVDEFSSDKTYSVIGGSVDLSSHTEPTTVYIYVKLIADWLNGGEFQLFPKLTIASQNFFSNDVQAPVDDLGQIYHNIGVVVITKPEDDLIYTLHQTVFGNKNIKPFDNTSYRINQIYQAKVTDETIDTTYQVYVNGGQSTLPDNTVQNIQVNDSILDSSTKYAYLQITATENLIGFWTGYNSIIVLSNSTLGNSNDEKNVLIGTAGLTLNQAQPGNFISDARVS
jgi:hypothetical protein